MKRTIVLFALFLMSFTVVTASAQEKLRLFIGTYTGKGENDAKGIYTCELDLEEGTLSEPRLAIECESPAFLAVHPEKPEFLYAVGEIWGPYENGGGPVYSFKIEKDGTLKHLNTEDVPGKGPCHLCVAAKDGNAAIVVASYGGGTVSSLPIRPDGKLGKVVSTIKHEGKLGPNKSRQEASHPHQTAYVPGFNLVVVPDLGFDQLFFYRINTKSGELRNFERSNGEPIVFDVQPPGSGPRHVAFVEKVNDEFYIWVTNELSSTLGCAIGIDIESPDNELAMICPISTLPEGVTPESCKNTTAEIFLRPDGKFIYVSNRGHDSIAVFKVNDITDVKLIQNEPCGGKEPRSFCIDPSGKYLIVANQNSDNLTVFKIGRFSGKLSPSGSSVKIPKPVCVISSP